jgi:hypothetical protein
VEWVSFTGSDGSRRHVEPSFDPHYTAAHLSAPRHCGLWLHERAPGQQQCM